VDSAQHTNKYYAQSGPAQQQQNGGRLSGVRDQRFAPKPKHVSNLNENVITKNNLQSSTLSPKQAVRTKSADEPRKQVLLTDQEKQQYGNRCPQGFKKQSLLGKGGIAIVWLAIDLETGEKVALKQFPKTGGKFDSSAGVEIQIQKVIAGAIARGCPGKWY
jgi:hypothetical protein